MQNFWKKYWPFIIAAMIFISVLFFHFSWKEWDDSSWWSPDGHYYYDLPPGNSDINPDVVRKGE